MDIEVYIFGNRTAFKTSAVAQWVWAPDQSKGRIEPYTGAVPNTAHLEQGSASQAKHLVFAFRQTRLDGLNMPRWARFGARMEQGVEVKASQSKKGKSNFLGVEMYGPFSWMARLLKGAGAKQIYGVHSPKVLFRWTASNLATYCDRLALANQKNPASVSDSEYNYYDDGEDD